MLSERLERFIQTLPDPEGAKLFLTRLQEEAPQQARLCSKNEELCANLLILASHSPLLAETMLQRPEYINWLERDRDLSRMKSKEELVEELARFSAVNSTLSDPEVLERFKRRELLRIYLRDCKKLATISETTAELSILADAILERTLRKAYQPLLARYGQPMTVDEQGKLASADIVIVALGKLGSCELNYSSDIDLMFIYYGDGETTGIGTGARESTTNKIFFTKLAETIIKTISSPINISPIFRVDLRLRPRGRDGDLVCSLNEATRYYTKHAQTWERQALLRARAAAGNLQILNKLMSSLEEQLFLSRPLSDALRDINAAKQKIDAKLRTQTPTSTNPSPIANYNVKLGRGGIREIEFIVQALQICYGGQEKWIRSPQIAIGLQRLAEKGFISESERSRLAAAYDFLRLCEHRLQMEHGLQTHTIPPTNERIELLARRCGFDSKQQFENQLQTYQEQVHAVYSRIFESSELFPRIACPQGTTEYRTALGTDLQLDESSTKLLGEVIAAYLYSYSLDKKLLTEALTKGLKQSYSPPRALKKNRDFLFSLQADPTQPVPNLKLITQFTTIAGRSHYFAELVISHPYLLETIQEHTDPTKMIDSLDNALEISSEDSSKQLRILWHRAILRIGCHDLLSTPLDKQQHLLEIYRLQTRLAEKTVSKACELAAAKVCATLGIRPALLKYAVIGLGRLGHEDLDYDSDLDLVLVYDETQPLESNISQKEVYAHLCETLVHILSSQTREGALYRTDLRLRPEGKDGELVVSSDRLAKYLSYDAATWELLAYTKARAISGNPDFCIKVEQLMRESIFNRKVANLAANVIEMRNRLEKEKGAGPDYRFAKGGLMDIYFVTRYLQLAYSIADPPQRNTTFLLKKLYTEGRLNQDQYCTLLSGYNFLSLLDHEIRLQMPRPVSKLPSSSKLLHELAQGLGLGTAANLQQTLTNTLQNIRKTYEQILG
ncbi:MAG: hypothetical protein RMM17_01785 [Acidobacteriota bacterium]|nr:hypothetical protein [Blastocatellia bacterium]MDW8411401.1 hypothetical protein [Acidobacteriota bacterium]